MQEVEIPGFVMEWDSGKKKKHKKNLKVVVYLKEELSCDVLTDHMKNY